MIVIHRGLLQRDAEAVTKATWVSTAYLPPFVQKAAFMTTSPPQEAPSSAESSRRLFRLAFLGLLAGACCIGLAPIFARFADVGPLVTGGYRLLVALAASGAIVTLRRGRPLAVQPERRELLIAALAGVFFAGDLAMYLTALHQTSVAHATLLINLAPVFAILGGWLLLGEKPSRATVAGMAIALSGAAVLALSGGGGGVVTLQGNLIALGGAIFYAAYLIALKRARTTVSPQVLLTVSAATGALILLPLGVLLGEPAIPGTLVGLGALIGLGTVAHTLGHGLISQSLSSLPVGYASVVLLVQPTVAAILAWILFAERLGPVELTGAFVTLLGVALASRRGS